MDIHDLYELCVQSPRHAVPLLRAIHGGGPAILGEDFAATAAVSRHWCRTVPGGRAVAVDLDQDLLARAADEPRVRRVVGDVRDDPAAGDPVDVVVAANFSAGYMHTRAELVAYLTAARRRLRPGGVVVCDTYGGESAFTLGAVERFHDAPTDRAHPGDTGPARIRYTWEQREADPLTGMVTNVLHFRLERPSGGAIEVLDTWPEAFTYRWRLWSPPELRDAMLEAGLTRTDVYAEIPDAVDDEGNAYVEPADGADLAPSFIVLVAGRAQGDR